MVVVATLRDGRMIARAAFTPSVLGAAGYAALTATVSDLRKVEYVLGINVTTSAIVTSASTPQNTSITGNVVGTTVYAGAATTVSGEVLAVGF